MNATPETKGVETLSELQKHCAEGNFDRMEAAWLRAVEGGQGLADNLEVFIEAAERFLGDEKKLDRLGVLLELLLPAVGDSASPRLVLRLYWLLVYCCPDKRQYVAAFCDRFEGLYPVASEERAFYETVGPSSSLDPVAALRRLERLLRFRQGAFVYHRSGWGVGRVAAVDPFLKQVKVDLEQKKGHRISVDVVDSILEPLDEESFLVLRHQASGELPRLRDEDPVRLVNLVCDAFGSSLNLKELKSHLVPTVVPSEAWNRWWNRAKGLLRETGLFRIGDRPPHAVERLQTAVNYAQELVAQYLRSGWNEARQIARQVARRTGGELAEAWDKIRAHLEKLCHESAPTQAIEAALILDRGEGGGGNAALGEVLSRLSREEVLAAIAGLSGVEDQRRTTDALPRIRPTDWQDIARDLFLGRKDGLRETAFELIERETPDAARRLVGDLVRSPGMSPEGFCFVILACLREPGRPSLEAFRDRGPRELLVLLMDLLDHLDHRAPREGRPATKAILGKVEDVFLEQDARVFREGLAAMETNERQDVHDRLVKNAHISVQSKGRLLDILTRLYPMLTEIGSTQPWDEKAIYVTAKGLARMKAEYRELSEVKMKKVAEDIGRAASFGDLSENAEFTAALEERDKLTKRIARLKEELDRTRVIDASRIREGRVGLGSRIRLRNVHTGDEVSYSILGPWDGGPEEGVLNYLSPLGRVFLGKKVGDTVEAQLPGGTETYQLLETTISTDAGT